MAGMNPITYLNSRDETERSLMQGVALAAQEIRRTEGENLVVQLSNNISKMLGG